MTHCQFCIQPIPKDPVIIFLDLDGVLMGDRKDTDLSIRIQGSVFKLFGVRESLIQDYTDLEWRTAAAEHLDQKALKEFEKLISKIQKTRPVQIVLSSAWRNNGTLQEIREKMFAKRSFSKLIIGKTPPGDWEEQAPEIKKGEGFSTIALKKYKLDLESRAQQIKFWLLEHELLKSDFVIFDDDDDKLSKIFNSRFILVENLFSKKEIDLASKVLNLKKLGSE